MKPDDVLARIVSALDGAGVPYMLTGSLASSIYGTPRATKDIDIVIAPTTRQLRKLKELLPESSYYFDLDDALDAFRRRSQFNVIDLASMWKVDLIFQKREPYDGEAFAHRAPIDHDGIRLFVTSAEDSIISKLSWAKLGDSQIQIQDVAGILRARRDVLDRPYLEHWVRELQLEGEWQAANLMAE